jgi:hypothetical protein
MIDEYGAFDEKRIGGGNRVLGGNVPQGHFIPITNPTQLDLGSNPGSRA